MWGDDSKDGGGGGGGFNTSYGGDEGGGFGTQQFASPGPEVKKSRRIESVLPLTILTILDLDENNQEYFGAQVNMVTVVGLIREVDITSTKITYTLDDTSGTIHAIKWLDSEAEEEPLMENTYCRVHGTFKTYQGNKQLLALHVEPITDLNWVTAHMLEVVHAALYLESIKTNANGTGKGDGSVGNSGIMSNSMVGIKGVSGSAGVSAEHALTPDQKIVFQLVRLGAEDADGPGISRDQLKIKLKGKMTPQQADNTIFQLSCEGHVYTTVDDDHFRPTDAEA